MVAKISRNHYEWSYTDEPHATRRELILRKYPQIKQLMRTDHRFKWIVTSMVFVQLCSLPFIQQIESYWLLFVLAYCFTGVINHSLFLAIHEIAHNQAFGPSRPLANKLFGIFANLPLGFPISVTFTRYHWEHHRYLGDETVDIDGASPWEAQLFNTTFRKFIWIILHPFFFAFRRFVVYPKPPTHLEAVNAIVQILFNFWVYVTFGSQCIVFLIGSSLVSLGLHPIAGHFITEHYIMFEQNRKNILNELVETNQIGKLTDEQLSQHKCINGVYAHNGQMLIPETSSYYGPLNWITFNMGYHVEHHDLPSIPFSLLPRVREIAPEFYNSLHSHSSWTYALFQYIFDHTMGPYCRVKRKLSKYQQ